MADSIKVSALLESTDLEMTDGGLILNSIEDTDSTTGYSSRKTPLSRLANYILNKFSGLSLAGAAQTVKSALDSLKSNSYLLSYASTAMKNGDDLDNYKVAGMYHSLTNAITSSLLHKPSWVTAGWLKLYVEMMSGGVRRQTLVNYNGSTLELLSINVRYLNEAGTTITDWKAEPTRAEMDAVATKTVTEETIELRSGGATGEVLATGTLTYTVCNNIHNVSGTISCPSITVPAASCLTGTNHLPSNAIVPAAVRITGSAYGTVSLQRGSATVITIRSANLNSQQNPSITFGSAGAIVINYTWIA